MALELQTNFEPPEFNNSAGRLLCLLKMLPSNHSYFDTIVQFYGFKNNAPSDTKGRAYLDFMALIGRAFDEFIVDVETSETIPEVTRGIIKEGLSDLINCAYPTSPNNSARKLQDAEIALLRTAASMLSSEPRIEKDDIQSIRSSIDELQTLLADSTLKPSARNAILELARLSRNAIDYYAIHGAKGFKSAFKKMLADLMEIYLHEGKETMKETWWTKAVEHLKKIDAVASRLLKYKPLLEGAGKLFLTDSSQPTDVT
jgi:hypothetical protein